jgi:hypothetical protein
VDQSTDTAVLVTNDANDYCGEDQATLHPDLVEEIHQNNPGCSVLRFASPQKLDEGLVKPMLKALAEEEAKTQGLLKKIQLGKYDYFKLEDVVTEAVKNLGSREVDGPFFAGDVQLEQPIWVATVEDPEDIEALALYKLEDGTFVCDGSAAVTATVEGYLDKFEAFNQSELGNVFVSDANWNDHYSEVEVSGVPAIIRFSFEFEPESSETTGFEVTNIESTQ